MATRADAFRLANRALTRTLLGVQALHQGLWLGLLDGVDLQTARFYASSSRYTGPYHNKAGLLGWEAALIDGAPLDRTTLDRVTDRLAPRAADAVGTWLDGPVGLGHRMLHATPESLQQKLPLASDTGEVVVTADARLDNRAELIPALGLAHRPVDGIGEARV